MVAETRPIKPQNGWPVSHLNGGSAGVAQVLSAPGKNLSYYLTGMIVSGGASGDGFELLRRNCVLLDATGENIIIASNAAIQLGTDDFSISMWIKMPTTTTTINSLMSKEEATSYIMSVTSGKFKFAMDDGTHTAVSITTDRAYNDNSWHNVIITCDRSEEDGLNIYVDGILAATAVDCSGASSSITGGGEPVRIVGSTNHTFYISSTGIYKTRVITAAEALDLYNAGVGYKLEGDETSLSAGWNFDEGTGTTVYDCISSVNGTITNASWANDGVPFDSETIPKLGKIAVGTVVTSGGLSGLGMTFPHAIKVGRNNPLRLLETDGGYSVIFFGYVDNY